MSANPKSLAKDSACWCLKGTAQRGAKLYLLNKWANASPAPACIPPAAPVLSMTAFVIVGAGYLNPAWTEAADPVLDFLFAYGTTLGGPYPNTVSFGASARNGIVPGVVAGTPYYGVIYARTSVSCVSLASNEASAAPIPPPVGQFTFAPATAVISWTELGVPHTGNLAAFNATAVLANVDSITATGLGLTSISGLSSLTNLSSLYLQINSLTTLNVSGLSVLDTLACSSNLITTITGLGDCHIISVIDCSTNLMDPAHVSSVLCDVDASGANTGDLDISHNSAPTAAGLICSASLDPPKGWSVTHD